MALVFSILVQHVPTYSSLGYIENLYVTFSYHMRNEECSYWEWPGLAEDRTIFCPLECATADGVTVSHSVSLIHIAHMMVMGCCHMLCRALSVLPQVYFHVIRASSCVTKIEKFDAEMLAFFWYVLFENHPSLEGNNNFVNSLIFGRVAKFGKCGI